ncbi:Uncharacterised protein [Bordetella pertussis]|nr:Uncharacterised protein [Bordetella pertussis]
MREVAGISRFHTLSASTSREIRRPTLRKNNCASSNSLGGNGTTWPSRAMERSLGSMR